MNIVKLKYNAKDNDYRYEYGKEYTAQCYIDDDGELLYDIEETGDTFTVYKDSEGRSYKDWFDLVDKNDEPVKDITLQDLIRMIDIREVTVEIWCADKRELIRVIFDDEKMEISGDLLRRIVSGIDMEQGLTTIWLEQEGGWL